MTGRLKEAVDGDGSIKLMEVQIPIISNAECKADYAAIDGVISDEQFDDAILCAGLKEGYFCGILRVSLNIFTKLFYSGKDSCQGDSVSIS